jgi:hypothetical protein
LSSSSSSSSSRLNHNHEDSKLSITNDVDSDDNDGVLEYTSEEEEEYMKLVQVKSNSRDDLHSLLNPKYVQNNHAADDNVGDDYVVIDSNDPETKFKFKPLFQEIDEIMNMETTASSSSLLSTFSLSKMTTSSKTKQYGNIR